ncbi:MAG TPA: EAL domain-containing protein, partial [Ilumatobacteraceae bacterium]|nr:EAL domain-containing protein [Ilumatobacteraceae bacterium]
FLLLLVAALRRRNGAPLLDRSMAADAAIVALCGWIAGWSLLVQDVTAIQGGRDAATILYGVAQPISLVTLFVAAVVVAGRRVRVPALWMLMAAVASATAADLVASVLASGHLVQTERWVLPLHIFAFFAGGAAMLHPSVTDLRRPPGAPRNDMPVRIGGVALCLVMAFVVLAATSPDDTIDLIVRTASTVALAGVVTIRVMSAARANHRAQAALLHGAQTDPLTGLANRGVLLERINDLLRTSWGPEVQPTLFFVDLDRFKNINDSLGHAAGDEVLIKVAKRLIDTVPESATVARMSGDEYVVLDPASRSQGASMALAERMLAVFREPLQLSQGDVFVTASIGVAAISATTTTSPEDLVRHADTAMYRAKDAGRNCVAVYDESMHERVAHRLAVETALYRALDRRELRLFHQPILDLTSGEVVGFEALMRWQQSDGTIVSPGEFIPIAEDTGTIVPIGSWALLEALSTLRKWIDEGVCNPQATMSVNVSPRQLADSNFPAIVSEALTRSGVSPQLLWLEVTESVMITEPELALATLRRLRSLGVRVAMDDFGTGYSSLSLLQKFPLQRIKIDRAFVHGVADNPNDRSLVRTIVAMGRSLGLDMVAEGVESVHQLQVLSDLGCTKAQGFLISHPVPTDAMRSTVAALERLGQFPGLRPNIAVPVN